MATSHTRLAPGNHIAQIPCSSTNDVCALRNPPFGVLPHCEVQTPPDRRLCSNASSGNVFVHGHKDDWNKRLESPSGSFKGTEGVRLLAEIERSVKPRWFEMDGAAY